MRYLPHTPEDLDAMLAAIGANSLDDLFESIPEACRRQDPMQLPEPLTEWELNDHMEGLARDMGAFTGHKSFIGAGSYEHFIPHTLGYLAGRSEFCTAYTPYQPEISQGTLQAVFEYQTLTARLLGMEVANASLYDGASALAEALLMAMRITRRDKIALSASVHPHYRQVVRTYLGPSGCGIIELPYLQDGRTDTSSLDEIEDLAAVAIQSPNFFGCIEDLRGVAQSVHPRQGLLVACFSEPIAYGWLRNPGSQGADIVCGEGQSLGLPRGFGGPGLGMLATRKEFLRNIPGRLVGLTRDAAGKRGFVLTLSTREQHIRREKATSNICTNSSLCAVTAAMFMACLGGAGLNRLARLNHDKAEYLKKGLLSAGATIPFSAPTFNEFVVRFPSDPRAVYAHLRTRSIVAGLPLDRFYPELSNHHLICATETKTRADLDDLLEGVTP